MLIVRLIWKLHQVCLDKFINIAIHHSIDIAGLVVGAVVFHAAIIEDIRADLASPFNFLLARLHFSLRLATFLQLQFIQLATQVALCVLAVLWLVARLSVLNHNFIGLVGEWVDELIVQTHA